MGLNDDFIKDPKGFMTKYPVIMGDLQEDSVVQGLPTTSGDFEFDIIAGRRGHELRWLRNGEKAKNGAPIKAFYLVYSPQQKLKDKDEVKSLAVFKAQLVSKASIFFTAGLTGCAFGAQRSQEKPNVIHIDGEFRNDNEIQKEFANKYGALYLGSQYKSSTGGRATILGVKDVKIWRFYAQPIAVKLESVVFQDSKKPLIEI